MRRLVALRQAISNNTTNVLGRFFLVLSCRPTKLSGRLSSLPLLAALTASRLAHAPAGALTGCTRIFAGAYPSFTVLSFVQNGIL